MSDPGPFPNPSRRAQNPIAPAAPWVPTSRGFLPCRLSDTGPGVCRTLRHGPESETLVWGLGSQAVNSRHSFFLHSSFFVRLEKPVSSSRPTHSGGRRAQGLSRTALLERRRRLVLDWPEHDGTLGAVGMTIRGEPALARAIAPQPCIRWAAKTPTMMHSCASAAKLRGGGPILHNGMTAMVYAGPRHLEPSSATRHHGADRAETVKR